MTALAIVTSDDAAWIASDGAAYTEPEGTLRQIVPKVILCPEWECVIGSRGMGGSAEAFRAAAQWKGATDFDGIVALSLIHLRRCRRTSALRSRWVAVYEQIKKLHDVVIRLN